MSDRRQDSSRTARQGRHRNGTGLNAVMRKYLPELVYGANDGIVTTFAIVAGIVGAALSTQAILILGFASLVADAISMGASNVLSERSRENRLSLKAAARCGLATFLGFIIAGFVPLLAYLLPDLGVPKFMLATILAAITLFAVGAARALFSDLTPLRAGFEMLLIGTAAGAVAYGIGHLGAAIVGNGG
jgi:vacuolar iron transporter family protein